MIDGVSKQFAIVSRLLNRPDVDTIYICTDPDGRRVHLPPGGADGRVKGKTRKRVWIDSQTEEEILRGIREAKDWSEYDNLAASAYLRAKEDYLMGINFFPPSDFKVWSHDLSLFKSGPTRCFPWAVS